jgi:hypothetical protein
MTRKSATLLATCVATAAATGRCNPESYADELLALEASLAPIDGATTAPGNLTFLPQDKGGESPACLDGSPYGFYFQPSTTGSNKWTISINGGGWCYDEVDCLCRSNSSLGSSKMLPPTSSCGCMNPNEDGTMDQDCNCLHLPYSDGASFSGFRAEPWPVPTMPGKAVTFRGIKNFDGVLDFAMGHGMTKASEFVITGGSAGGLR